MKSYESLLDKVAQIRRFVAGKPLDDIADAAQAIREDGLARGLRLAPRSIVAWPFCGGWRGWPPTSGLGSIAISVRA